MRVLLISNYENDRQESMLRFAAVLRRHLPDRGMDVDCMRPEPCFGRIRPAATGLGKWLGYLDKFVVFPKQLRRKLADLRASRGAPFIVHICDHSNAFYTSCLQAIPHVVTCHDLLAVRAAQGEFPAFPTRWSGRRLQHIILKGLNRARRVACASQATRNSVLTLTGLEPAQVEVLYNGLNYPFAPLPRAAAWPLIRPFFKSSAPASKAAAGEPSKHEHCSPAYLLHVGGNPWYKNRLGVLKIYSELLKARSPAPLLVMAGPPFTAEMDRWVGEQHLEERVVRVTDCDNEALRALYAQAELFIFPSLEEGFGWPIIEAQACGCRVATTDKAPMSEVSGDCAFFLQPARPDEAARQVWRALEETGPEKDERIHRGLLNASRFSTEKMIDDYARFYRRGTGAAGA